MRTSPHTRRIRLMSWYASKCYVLGIASATSWGLEGGHTETCNVYYRGKRVYVFGWPRWKWRCVLKFHHWPTPYTVAFGMCGKCVPWPCCGAITIDHAPGCVDAYDNESESERA